MAICNFFLTLHCLAFAVEGCLGAKFRFSKDSLALFLSAGNRVYQRKLLKQSLIMSKSWIGNLHSFYSISCPHSPHPHLTALRATGYRLHPLDSPTYALSMAPRTGTDERGALLSTTEKPKASLNIKPRDLGVKVLAEGEDGDDLLAE